MCEYCKDDPAPMIETTYGIVDLMAGVNLTNKRLYSVAFYTGDGAFGQIDRRPIAHCDCGIKYCPMCGRKL